MGDWSLLGGGQAWSAGGFVAGSTRMTQLQAGSSNTQLVASCPFEAHGFWLHGECYHGSGGARCLASISSGASGGPYYTLIDNLLVPVISYGPGDHASFCAYFPIGVRQGDEIVGNVLASSGSVGPQVAINLVSGDWEMSEPCLGPAAGYGIDVGSVDGVTVSTDASSSTTPGTWVALSADNSIGNALLYLSAFVTSGAGLSVSQILFDIAIDISGTKRILLTGIPYVFMSMGEYMSPVITGPMPVQLGTGYSDIYIRSYGVANISCKAAILLLPAG